MISRIAVLLTCHNRRQQTLKCLGSVEQQELNQQLKVEVFLVNDGCTDGTAHAVREQFPETQIIEGDGNLYWAGGMKKAWQVAAARDFDAFLWLNDDTFLDPNAIDRLCNTAFC